VIRRFLMHAIPAGACIVIFVNWPTDPKAFMLIYMIAALGGYSRGLREKL
jgi:hypothetical protein